MNAKRMLSLILSALMVASMTTVAFADGPYDYTGPGDQIMWVDSTSRYYYKDADSGVLRPANPSESFKPGDTIYISTSWDSGAKTKDLNAMKVYVDWTLGDKYVEKGDVKITYAKATGAVGSNVYTVSVTIAGQTYTVEVGSDTVLTQTQLKDAVIAEMKAKNTYDPAIVAEADRLLGTLSQKTYYQVGATWYDNGPDAIAAWKAANPGSAGKEAGYSYNGTEYRGSNALTELEKVLASLKVSNGYKDSKGNYSASLPAGYTDATGKYGEGKEGTAVFDDAETYITTLEGNGGMGYTKVTGDTYVVGSTVYPSLAAVKSTLGTAVAAGTNSAYKETVASVTIDSQNKVVAAGTSGGTVKDSGFVLDNTWYADETSLEAAATKKTGYTKSTTWVETVAPTSLSSGFVKDGKYTTSLGDWTEVNSGYVKNNIYYANAVDVDGVTKLDAVTGSTDEEILKKLTSEIRYNTTGSTWVNADAAKTWLKDNTAKTNVDTAINAAAGAAIPKAKTTNSTTTSYRYFVAVPTKANSTTRVLDVIGNIGVGKTTTTAKKYTNFEMQVGLTNGKYDGGSVVSDVHIDKPDSPSVVKFDKDADDIEITWGDNTARFEVNVSGQGDLNLRYSVKFNSDFADMYSSANIDFLNFVANPSFNRTGTLYIYANKDSYIYEVTEDGAKKIPSAKYDKDEEAWVIRTRKLGSYAISDKKLKTVDQMESSSKPSDDTSTSTGGSTGGNTSKPSNGDKYNPDTGR